MDVLYVSGVAPIFVMVMVTVSPICAGATMAGTL